MPKTLVEALSARQLGLMAAALEAAYLDGYTAAGGDASDTVAHHMSAKADAVSRR